MNVDAVIFDLDGTLIDTLDIYCRILNIALERLGFQPVAKEIVVDAAREGEFDWSRVLPGEPGSSMEDMVERVRALIEDMYKKALDEEAELIPGASEILKKIPTLGLKMALVTSTPFRYLQIKLNPLRKAGVADLFDVVITSDDVTRKKPAPDPLITCGQRLGVPVERGFPGGHQGGKGGRYEDRRCAHGHGGPGVPGQGAPRCHHGKCDRPLVADSQRCLSGKGFTLQRCLGFPFPSLLF